MQDTIWEREYQNPQLVTKDDKPQSDTLEFFRWLKKKRGMAVEGLKVLDLGSGTGRNANYLAELGNDVVGMEISATAVELAKKRAASAESFGVPKAVYLRQSIGEKFAFANETFDVALDVTSSNSLDEKEREVYLSETSRVLKTGGYFFVKALCKDGDDNAKNLIKKFPGPEKDTYINQEMGLTERVFTEVDLREMYSKYFKIISLEKKTNYTRFNNQSYKRNFWLVYLEK